MRLMTCFWIILMPVLLFAQSAGWASGEDGALGSVNGQIQNVGWVTVTRPSGLLLTDSLLAYWRMDEAVDQNRIDFIHSYSLVPPIASGFHSPGRASGKISYAADFEADESISMLIATGTPFNFSGGMSFCISCWVKVESWTSVYFVGIVTKYEADGGNREYGLFLDCNRQKFDFRVSPTGSTAYSATVTATTGSWVFLTGWYDADTDSVYISKNNESPTKTYCPGPPANKSRDFVVGYNNVSPTNKYKFDGLVDCLAVWRGRCPKSTDSWKMMQDIYNSGSGWQP